MHDLTDIKRIVENHYTEGGRSIEKGDVQRAEILFSEGLSQLKVLKLTPSNRRNIRLLRNAFERAIKSTQMQKKGRTQQAIDLLEQSAGFAYRYNAAVRARVRGK